jgi:hypothetical protein
MAVARRLAPILAAALAVGACGEDPRQDARERVDAYVHAQQELMRSAKPQLDRANRAYVAFARGRLEPARAEDQLAGAERAIATTRDSVTVLAPPAEARRLHAGILRYLDANVDLAGETTRLAGYAPAAEKALVPLGRANRRLEHRLRAADGAPAQAAALARYRSVIAAGVRGLRDIDPPAVLEPAHRDQMRRLSAASRLAGALRRALLAEDAERVARLLARFRAAADRGADKLSTAQARAGYVRRLEGLDAAVTEVRREERRLDRRLR